MISNDWLFATGARGSLPGAAAVILRLGAGATLAYFHGWHKLSDAITWRSGRRDSWPFVTEIHAAGFPAAVVTAWLATAVQFLGGICLLVGLFTRPAAALILATLAGAVVTNLRLRKDLQLVSVYLLVLCGVFCLGPGAWSLDRILFQ
jgi:putative oxidoreductase